MAEPPIASRCCRKCSEVCPTRTCQRLVLCGAARRVQSWSCRPTASCSRARSSASWSRASETMRSDPSFTELRVAAPLDRHRVEGVPAHSSRRHAHRGQQPGEEGGGPSAADSRLSRSCRTAHGSCREQSRPCHPHCRVHAHTCPAVSGSSFLQIPARTKACAFAIATHAHHLFCREAKYI